MPFLLSMPRRNFLKLLSVAPVAYVASGLTQLHAATGNLSFAELYSKVSVLGLEFSEKVKSLNGEKVVMGGFMAPPLKAEADFFVLTEIPMSICPFCSSDADWPDNILVVYLDKKQTFVQPSTLIEVTGKLEVGSWTDPETGFVSLLRLRDARYKVA